MILPIFMFLLLACAAVGGVLSPPDSADRKTLKTVGALILLFVIIGTIINLTASFMGIEPEYPLHGNL